MKKLSLFLFTFYLAVQAFPQKYVKVWGDEFNTPGLPDSTKWDYEMGKVRNDELQYYTFKRSENARIQDTVLIIEARKEAYKGASYTSASLISRYKGDWLYGKFEIRAKVPTGKGTWPAIWMMPTDDEYGGWPKSGEIDIMEYVGMNPSNLYFTAHFGSDSGAGHKSSGNYTTAISQPYNKFITFSLIWTPTKMEWFADGVKYHTYTKTSDDPKVWPFNKMFYFILNLAYGGSWGAQQGIDDAKLPHKFFIDYVRVYQLQESAGPFSLKIEPATGGTVEISPQLSSYPEGTKVTLTAKPDANFEFDKWLHTGSANPIQIEVSKDLNMTPVFKKKNELIVNGDFSLVIKYWGNFYFYSAQQKATASVIDGVYVVNVTSPGTANWHIVDQYLNIPLVQGTTYKISFDAWSENPNQMDVFLAENHDNYVTYYSTIKNISNTRQSYTWTVTMSKASDPNCRFGFGFGRFTGKVFLDNVSIEKVTATNSVIWPEKSADIHIFPNPNSGIFEMISHSSTGLPSTVKLYNLQGQLISILIQKGVLPSGQSVRFNLDGLKLDKGIYFLTVSTLERSSTQKIVIN
ncbi:MAG: family 16 glycosylhydrolase [Bacteroidota bacterium]|nr:family 16 glycosylhydrolase [Bacteroidota bacterium]